MSVKIGSIARAGTVRSNSAMSVRSPVGSALPSAIEPSGKRIVNVSSAIDQVDRIGIRGAFEIPCSLDPSGRANRKRRSPTAPSRRRSIASGWCNAVDFTGVTLKRATVAMGMRGA